MSHILVTGGAGFIGSHLVDSLLADGFTVTVLDNFDGFYPRAVKERNISGHRGHPRWRLVEGDVRDLPAMREQLPARPRRDRPSGRQSRRASVDRGSLRLQDVNIRGTQNLLEFARERSVPHFVFASSSSVYGVNPRVPWSEEDHVLQTDQSLRRARRWRASSSDTSTVISTAFDSSRFDSSRCTDPGSGRISPSTSSRV